MADTSATSAHHSFLIPYEKNEHFIGRKALLAKLHEKLSESVPKQFNHRVALYGLGGVGKTQLALEYVNTHKDYYAGIYWISGVNQATLLSGFQEIARRTSCIPAAEFNVSPSAVAKAVLLWLNQQDNWLLVIDNLDDADVVDGYLPERSLGRHTLLTMRNPNAIEIPAEGLRVGILDLDEAVELLIVRSGLGSVDDRTPEEIAEAMQIVEELGFLPLAIEQASAYIREISKDIFKFLPLYKKDKKKYHGACLPGEAVNMLKRLPQHGGCHLTELKRRMSGHRSCCSY